MKAAAVRIALLFNPAGAIVQALEAIYRVLKWIFENAARIFTLIETVVNGVADILAGNIGGFANAVEKGLELLIAPVIGFIADYLGFGDLPATIASKVKSFQQWILGLIETALVWLIDKGKALLAVVGIGKTEKEKDKDKKKAGADAGEHVGEEIDFEADDESHSLWVDVTAGHATLMVASTPQSLGKFIAHVEQHGPPKARNKATEVSGLLSKANVDADKLAKAAVHVPEKDESKGAAALTQMQKSLTDEEKAIVALLKEIFKAMNPLKQVIGQPIDSLKEVPYGYALRPIKGFNELQRAAGFGTADEKMFPRVHVDANDLVQEGPGISRYDRDLIKRYRAAVDAVRQSLKDDEAPALEGSPEASANKLESSKNMEASFVVGTREEMEAFIRAVDQGQVTGREVRYFGRRSADWTVARTVKGGTIDVLVEYKHWSGNLTMDKREKLVLRLSEQLSYYVIDATRGRLKYVVLEVIWPGFKKLDAESQRIFKEVIDSFREAAGPGGLRLDVNFKGF
jgi:hypothetical protein